MIIFFIFLIISITLLIAPAIYGIQQRAALQTFGGRLPEKFSFYSEGWKFFRAMCVFLVPMLIVFFIFVFIITMLMFSMNQKGGGDIIFILLGLACNVFLSFITPAISIYALQHPQFKLSELFNSMSSIIFNNFSIYMLYSGGIIVTSLITTGISNFLGAGGIALFVASMYINGLIIGNFAKKNNFELIHVDSASNVIN